MRVDRHRRVGIHRAQRAAARAARLGDRGRVPPDARASRRSSPGTALRTSAPSAAILTDADAVRALARRDRRAPTRCCIWPPTAIRRRRPSARGGISSRTRSRSSRSSSTVRPITSSTSRPARCTTVWSAPVSPPTPVSPRLPYAISKLASEQYVALFRRAAAQPSAATSTSASSAPTDRTRPPRKITTRWLRAMTAGQREFTLRGNGENLIDFMYVDDAVDGFLRWYRRAGTSGDGRFRVGRSGQRQRTSSRTMAQTLGVDVTIRHEGHDRGVHRVPLRRPHDARSVRRRADDVVRGRLRRLRGVLRTGEACGRPPA